MIWTAPDGETHTTQPSSRIPFPALCKPTAPVDLSAAEIAAAAATADAQPGRGLAMPRRRRTRAQDRAARIEAERRLNETEARTADRPAHDFTSWLAALPPGDGTPPPF